MHNLPSPGIKQLEEKLNLRDKAATAAESNSISPNDTVYDEGQKSVIHEMGEILADGRSKTSTSLERYNERRVEIAAELENFSRQSFSGKVKGAVNIVLKDREEDLVSTQRKEKKALLALNAYRLRHNIKRPPRYPEWRIMHWAIVITLFFLESVANSQFFAKASPFGLVGGWMQAGIISATNIGIGLAGGMAVIPWRNRWESLGKSTKLPTAVAITFGFFLLLFNLATAHYRVLLEDMPKQAIKLAIGHLWNSPFAIDNFEAWILLFVGILFSGVAWIEGYKSDDPLREYGRLARRYEKARQISSEEKNKVRAAAVNEFNVKKNELKDSVRKAKILVADFTKQLSRSKADAKQYREWRQQIEETTETLLSRYQEYYQQVNKLDSEPGYFKNKFAFPEDAPFLEEEDRISNAEAELSEFKEIIDELIEIRKVAEDQESEIISEVEDTVDEFFAQTKKTALQQTENDTFPVDSSADSKTA